MDTNTIAYRNLRNYMDAYTIAFRNLRNYMDAYTLPHERKVWLSYHLLDEQ